MHSSHFSLPGAEREQAMHESTGSTAQELMRARNDDPIGTVVFTVEKAL